MSKGKDIASLKSSEPRWFRSSPIYAQPDLKVDAEKGLIKDVSVCSAGEAKGHGVMLEQSFINDVVRLGNEWKQGLKCRFGHPNMSTEALGTYLGRFTNFRVEGSKAIADLQLDEVSKKAPGGDLFTYVVGMAQNNPDMFGASIEFNRDYLYFYDDKGEKVQGYSPDDRPTYITIQDLLAADIVDSPAANEEGLFSSNQFNSKLFAVRATDFLDQNPDIWKFVESHPDKFKPFLDKYAAYKQKQSIKMSKKNVKQKGFFAKLAAAIVSGQASDAFATIDATTTAGNNIRIASENDEPTVGDEVYVVAEDGSESVAPDGDHTITGGAYDKWVLTVADGKISSITKPDASVETPTDQPVSNSSQQQAAKGETAKLKAENEDLKKQLKAKADELEAFKKQPLDDHTSVVPGEVEAPQAKSDQQFWNQPWNKKHQKTA